MDHQIAELFVVYSVIGFEFCAFSPSALHLLHTTKVVFVVVVMLFVIW